MPTVKKNSEEWKALLVRIGKMHDFFHKGVRERIKRYVKENYGPKRKL